MLSTAGTRCQVRPREYSTQAPSRELSTGPQQVKAAKGRKADTGQQEEGPALWSGEPQSCRIWTGTLEAKTSVSTKQKF